MLAWTFIRFVRHKNKQNYKTIVIKITLFLK